MGYFVVLVIDGALAGAMYALIALAFVLVYKASRMVNFALGAWVMAGALLTAAGLNVLGLGLAGALAFAALGMVGFAAGFNRLVLRRLVARPAIAAIMVTLGLDAAMRGLAPLVFAGVPPGIALPIPADPVVLGGRPVATDKIVAGAVATLCIVAIGGFYRYSRTGLALRAIADDPQAAMSMGIDINRHLLIVWGLTGIIAAIAGALWTFVAGGGFGVALVGLKVFPIVIIGGLDSIPGALIAAMLIGVIETLGSGYVDPWLGGGFGSLASYLALIAMLAIRPYGLFGQAQIERI